jgi:two-component system, OmpR family, phosphate regulon sensor histidine kinase PhoR
MLMRWFGQVALPAALAGWGAVWMGVWGATLGAAVGGGLVWALDVMRTLRLSRWIRTGDLAVRLRLGGIWGEMGARFHRLLLKKEQETHDAKAQLTDFLLAIQSSPNGVVLLDKAGHIEWCNTVGGVHWGLDSQRDLGQLITHLVRDPAFVALINAEAQGRVEQRVAGRGITAAGPVVLGVIVHAYGDGRRLLLSRDVTLQDQAEAMRRDFVANVSHEIRTPLTVLSGFVETLQTLPLSDAEQRHMLDLMAQQSDRMQALVSDLLALSRLEGSPVPLADQWIDLPRLLTQVLVQAQALSALMNTADNRMPVHTVVLEGLADFANTGDGRRVEISGERDEWFSAVFNLAANAVRYTPAGGTVRIAVQPREARALAVVVSDSGPGIAAEHLPRLTERFYRVDRSRSRETGGTGLGLAIVKHVCLRHGGQLDIASQPGQGATFTVLIPPSRVRVPGALL